MGSYIITHDYCCFFVGAGLIVMVIPAMPYSNDEGSFVALPGLQPAPVD